MDTEEMRIVCDWIGIVSMDFWNNKFSLRSCWSVTETDPNNAMELCPSGVDTSYACIIFSAFCINMNFIILFQGHTEITFFFGGGGEEPGSETSCLFKKLDDGLIPKKEICISEYYIVV